MSRPVHACEENEYLEIAIRKMIFSEVHRLFVYQKDPKKHRRRLVPVGCGQAAVGLLSSLCQQSHNNKGINPAHCRICIF